MTPPESSVQETHVLLSDLVIGESPRWHDDRLWFSNWGASELIAADLDGNSEVALEVPTTFPFSVDWLHDGRLLIVSGQEALILRQEPDGSVVTHADLSPLSDRPWHEIVVDGRGNTYVNSICFDFIGGEQPRPGIIAMVAPDGSVREVAGDLDFPNGMVVTPDNSTLIVAESFAGRLTAFDIEADGGLSNRRAWAELGGPGAGDGITMDEDGAIWCSAMRRVMRVREGGEVVESLSLDRPCFACMLGGPDGRTLFMCAAEWHGPDKMFDGPRSGQVVTARAPAPRAGRP